MTMRTPRLVLAVAAAIALSGCGLVDAFIFPIGLFLPTGGEGEGGNCQSTYDCGDPDLTGLVCDSVNLDDGTCAYYDTTDLSPCEDAADELEVGEAPGDLIIFEAMGSVESETSAVINVTQVCLYGSFLAIDVEDSLPNDLATDGPSRLEVETDADAPIRPGDRNFIATADYDEPTATYSVTFEDCWTDAAGTADLPTQFAVQLFRDDIPSNVMCMPGAND